MTERKNMQLKCSPALYCEPAIKSFHQCCVFEAALNIALNLRDKVLLLGCPLHCAQEGSARWKDRELLMCLQQERTLSITD